MTALRLVRNEEVIVARPVVEIVPTTPQHLRELAPNLREEDKAEILAFGLSLEKALWRSYKSSVMRRTALIDGEVAATWGVCGHFLGTVGAAWLLTGKAVNKVSPLKFTRIYQEEVKEMLRLFPSLCNIVDANHSAAIRLLSIVGFKLHPPEVMGKRGKLFIRFERAR